MSALDAIQATINNVTYGVKPNSVTFTAGRGERMLRTKQSGSGVTNVVSKDAETQFSVVKFTLLSETDTPATVTEWQDNFDNNRIVLVDPDGNPYTFNRAVITADPEHGVGAEGEVEIEWNSEPMIQG